MDSSLSLTSSMDFTPKLRMLSEARPDHKTDHAAIKHVAAKLGVNPETLRLWKKRLDVDEGLALREVVRRVDVVVVAPQHVVVQCGQNGHEVIEHTVSPRRWRTAAPLFEG